MLSDAVRRRCFGRRGDRNALHVSSFSPTTINPFCVFSRRKCFRTLKMSFPYEDEVFLRNYGWRHVTRAPIRISPTHEGKTYPTLFTWQNPKRFEWLQWWPGGRVRHNATEKRTHAQCRKRLVKRIAHNTWLWQHFRHGVYCDIYCTTRLIEHILNNEKKICATHNSEVHAPRTSMFGNFIYTQETIFCCMCYWNGHLQLL